MGRLRLLLLFAGMATIAVVAMLRGGGTAERVGAGRAPVADAAPAPEPRAPRNGDVLEAARPDTPARAPVLEGRVVGGPLLDGLRIVAVPRHLVRDPVHPGRLRGVPRRTERVRRGGAFTFDDLEPGEYRLLLDDDRWMCDAPVFARVPGPPVEVRAVAAASFLVIVENFANGRRVPDTRAELFRGDTSLSGPVAGQNGVIWFRAPLPPDGGTPSLAGNPQPASETTRRLVAESRRFAGLRLVVSAPGFRSATRAGPPRRGARVLLRPAGEFTLVLDLRDGAASLPERVEITRRMRDGHRLKGWFRPDADGRHRVELAPGGWHVEVRLDRPFAVSAALGRVDGVAGETQVYVLAAPPSGRVEFAAEHDGGVFVELTRTDAPQDADADVLAPRSAGHVFRFENRAQLLLPAGRYVLVAYADGTRGWEHGFIVTAGQTAGVAIPPLRERKTVDDTE